MKYMIHTCNQRRWYVNKFLIPSMLEQGIKKEDITVAVDTHNAGNLIATMQMFDYIGRTENWNDIIWHLQDDIVISKIFKQRTEELYGEVICGFCSEYDNSKRWGCVTREELWYSFPCIGIKNYIAKDCADWFFQKAVYNPEYKNWIAQRKHDDLFFQEFLAQYGKHIKYFNANPNLVDHVDYLIGGSLVNPKRDNKVIKSVYWIEPETVDNLRQKLSQTGVCFSSK